jgi:protein SCO1/2
LFEISEILRAMGPDAGRINAYFVSVDPERDTPDVMNAYVSNFSDRITGISGPPDKVWAMAKGFNIYFRKVETDGGDYTMDHTASVILLNRKGDFAGTIAYGESGKAALAKLKRLEAGA